MPKIKKREHGREHTRTTREQRNQVPRGPPHTPYLRTKAGGSREWRQGVVGDSGETQPWQQASNVTFELQVDPKAQAMPAAYVGGVDIYVATKYVNKIVTRKSTS
jgi:hypothetical protein